MSFNNGRCLIPLYKYNKVSKETPALLYPFGGGVEPSISKGFEVLCFLWSNAIFQWKVENGKWKLFTVIANEVKQSSLIWKIGSLEDKKIGYLPLNNCTTLPQHILTSETSLPSYPHTFVPSRTWRCA